MYGKILIRCELEVLTGLHIGTSGAFSAIGAVDSPVVRDPFTQLPIVPGSSLKGKLRSLLARSLSRDINKMPDFDKDHEVIRRLFGTANPVRRSRLQFADCFVVNADRFQETGITEVKTENAIDRITSVANPRQIERVVRGVKFGVCIAYDVIQPDQVQEDMEQLAHAMRLLQLDYLGGHGSRGSGRVSFSGFRFEQVESDYPEDQLKAIFDKVENYELLPV